MKQRVNQYEFVVVKNEVKERKREQASGGVGENKRNMEWVGKRNEREKEGECVKMGTKKRRICICICFWM